MALRQFQDITGSNVLYTGVFMMTQQLDTAALLAALQNISPDVLAQIIGDQSKPQFDKLKTTREVMSEFNRTEGYERLLYGYTQNNNYVSDSAYQSYFTEWCQRYEVKTHMYNRQHMSAAFDIVARDAYYTRKEALTAKLCIDPTPETSEWQRLEALTSFDYLSVIVLKRWMWAVKRILKTGQQVQTPMPVLFSTQGGTGKSFFVRELLKPLEDFSAVKSVNEISDGFGIDQWERLLVADFDEMSGLEKTDLNKLKSWATADVLTGRKIYSDQQVRVKKLTQGIGSSNFPIEQIIWDTTGTRRFFQINVTQPILQACRSLDFLKLWQEVDYDKFSDPAKGFETQIFKQQQEVQRKQTDTELWFEDLNYTVGKTQSLKDLYQNYAIWCQDTGTKQRDIRCFGRDFDNYLSEYCEKKRAASGVVISFIK